LSKLEQLIDELCPDGVEYKPLEDIAKFRRGSFPQPYGNSSWYGGDDAMPFVQVADVADNGFNLNNQTKQMISKLAQPLSVFVEVGTVIVSLQGTIGKVAVTQYDSYVDRTLAIFTDYKVAINKKYFAYQLKNKFDLEKVNARGSTLKTITKEEFSKFEIPLPPLPVQDELVRILDNYTELTTELTAELTSELNARKQQYEHYRDELFGKGYDEMIHRCLQNNVDVITLEDLGSFTRGKRFVRDDIRDEGTPCIHYGDLYTYYGISAEKTKYFLDEKFSEKMRFAHKGDVVIVQAGENDMDIGIGVAWMGDEDVAVHDACYIFKHSINPKYISHYLRTSIYHLQIKKYVSTGKICSISAQGIGKAKIPIPSLPEQQHIVEILDHFDALCNDISKRLQAEIKARQQQYEYYRDKLLTFKEKEGMQDE